MRKFQNFMKIFAVSAVFAFVSCETEEAEADVLTTDALSQEVINQIEALAFNSEGAELRSIVRPDGTTDRVIMAGGDIELDPDRIMDMSIYADQGGIQSEQYRTNNLVSQPRTISVIGYTGGQFALSTRGRTGLQWAINNYNRLNLGIRFTLQFATSTNADMVIYDNSVNNPGSSGGSAGFPVSGNPHKFIQIYGLSGSSNNVNEHVITHEMGHAVGFRHTDYFSRQSCGQNVNEGSAGVGAVHIPGTPTGFDPNSIMLACFNSGVNGEFNANDRTALRFLY